ncbi:hypothetical protein ACFOWM_03480 [Ferruginibacter yonginensis]|uniref:Uncharacterized protein n=1 Tax=Ferruginibacter yonginensis TaxID=1310416 RepID=A0ABV8QQL0_9BACT
MVTPKAAVTATKPTNGQTPTVTNAQTATPPPVQNPKVEKLKVADELPPLEDRLHKIDVLIDQQRRYLKLAETKTKLEKFETAHNRDNSELILSDDEGHEFKTTNPDVIKEVTKLVFKIVTEKAQVLADQLKW